ncbi:MAG: histidine phosphatase family protein [Pseudomonadota bacterium]
MKLILTRHAKSSWDDLSSSDHERLLTRRGKVDAGQIGAWLMMGDHVPATVMSSTAERAKWTSALIIENMTPRPEVTFDSGLYHASPDAILAQIRRAPPGDLMIVGHNPGISALATLLLPTRPDHEKFAKYPTAATTVLNTNVSRWRDMGFSDATLIDFVVPRDLDDPE